MVQIHRTHVVSALNRKLTCDTKVNVNALEAHQYVTDSLSGASNSMILAVALKTLTVLYIFGTWNNSLSAGKSIDRLLRKCHGVPRQIAHICYSWILYLLQIR